ncbi:hypothetical protein Tsubulata_018587 [Turnera subulata]|uniref:Uncharacterized protein n=1 Tax=Turnera subulata TaxID=218843 RepID=A0A9Q0G4A5_9ROSI|nr:hypothetical protein Tsubulata_018587 [Turnera subulata]
MVFHHQSYDCSVRATEPQSLHSSPSSSPFRYIYQTIHKKYQRLDYTVVPRAVSYGPSQEWPAGSPCSLFDDGYNIVLRSDLSRFLPCLIADVEQRNTLIQTIVQRVSERLSRWSESWPTPVVTIYVYKVVKELLEGTGSVEREYDLDMPKKVKPGSGNQKMPEYRAEKFKGEQLGEQQRSKSTSSSDSAEDGLKVTVMSSDEQDPIKLLEKDAVFHESKGESPGQGFTVESSQPKAVALATEKSTKQIPLNLQTGVNVHPSHEYSTVHAAEGSES